MFSQQSFPINHRTDSRIEEFKGHVTEIIGERIESTRSPNFREIGELLVSKGLALKMSESVRALAYAELIDSTHRDLIAQHSAARAVHQQFMPSARISHLYSVRFIDMATELSLELDAGQDRLHLSSGRRSSIASIGLDKLTTFAGNDSGKLLALVDEMTKSARDCPRVVSCNLFDQLLGFETNFFTGLRNSESALSQVADSLHSGNRLGSEHLIAISEIIGKFALEVMALRAVVGQFQSKENATRFFDRSREEGGNPNRKDTRPKYALVKSRREDLNDLVLERTDIYRAIAKRLDTFASVTIPEITPAKPVIGLLS